MRRRVFNAVSLLSLMLCAATVGLWVLSYGLDEVGFVRQRRLGRAVADLNREQLILSETQMPPSFRRADVTRYWFDTDYEIHLCWGRVGWATVTDYCVPRTWDVKPPIHWVRSTWPRVGFHATASPPITWGTNPGISYQNTVDRSRTQTFGGSYPIWPVAIGAAVLPFLWVRARTRGRPPHQCPACSYDLTGNTSGVCPECGTAVPGRI